MTSGKRPARDTGFPGLATILLVFLVPALLLAGCGRSGDSAEEHRKLSLPCSCEQRHQCQRKHHTHGPLLPATSLLRLTRGGPRSIQCRARIVLNLLPLDPGARAKRKRSAEITLRDTVTA